MISLKLVNFNRKDVKPGFYRLYYVHETRMLFFWVGTNWDQQPYFSYDVIRPKPLTVFTWYGYLQRLNDNSF